MRQILGQQSLARLKICQQQTAGDERIVAGLLTRLQIVANFCKHLGSGKVWRQTME